MEGTITLKELREEVLAMFAVCFEGSAQDLGSHMEIRLPGGQCFRVCVEEE